MWILVLWLLRGCLAVWDIGPSDRTCTCSPLDRDEDAIAWTRLCACGRCCAAGRYMPVCESERFHYAKEKKEKQPGILEWPFCRSVESE